MRDDRRKRITRALLEILQAIETEGERSQEGSWTNGRTAVDYSVSVGGLQGDDRFGGEYPLRSANDGASPAVAIREYEDDLILVADIPDAQEEDVSVDLEDDGQMLRILVDDSVIGRVPLGDGRWRILDESFNHNILEVRFADE